MRAMYAVVALVALVAGGVVWYRDYAQKQQRQASSISSSGGPTWRSGRPAHSSTA